MRRQSVSLLTDELEIFCHTSNAAHFLIKWEAIAGGQSVFNWPSRLIKSLACAAAPFRKLLTRYFSLFSLR
jgi:hypothetical protein